MDVLNTSNNRDSHECKTSDINESVPPNIYNRDNDDNLPIIIIDCEHHGYDNDDYLLSVLFAAL